VCSNRGFTLLEALVALVIGVAVVLGIGALGERLIHHRVTTDSNSAAMSLAERQLEALLADPVRDPTTAQCPAANLCSGTHGPNSVDVNLASSTSGPYRVRWTIVDATTASTSLFVLATTGGAAQKAVKQITVTVSHLTNTNVNATLVRYYKVT
jgi:Tfp pilus assembly protein PilV